MSRPTGEAELVLGHELLGVVDGRRRRLLARRPRHRDRAPLVRALPRLRRGLARLVPHRRLQRARHHAPRRLRARARRRGRSAADPDPAVARPAGRARRADVDLRSARSGTRCAIGGREPWQLERALVLGAGAIGMLSTYLLRLDGVDVWTAALEPQSDLVSRVRRALRLDGRRAARRASRGGRRLRPRDRGRAATRS